MGIIQQCELMQSFLISAEPGESISLVWNFYLLPSHLHAFQVFKGSTVVRNHRDSMVIWVHYKKNQKTIYEGKGMDNRV